MLRRIIKGARASNGTPVQGLDFIQMCRDDYASPFFGKSPHDASFQQLPPGFRPTYLQCSISHHPMWDIFPDTTIRDNVLALYGGDDIAENELCLNLVGDGTSGTLLDVQSNAGMLLWSEPWDIRSREATEGFARKWSWFVKDAFLLLASTNQWRRRREEPSLSYDVTGKITCMEAFEQIEDTAAICSALL